MDILFVDDDTDDKDIFFEAINDINPEIECTVARNGKEALEVLLSESPLPRYIFLDINMPVMDGRAFLLEIKKVKKLRDIPVVIYSTTEDKEEIKRLKALGAEYLGKPTSYEVLKRSLSKYLANQ
jgi:CheY-like chemotaxis protein